MNPYYPHLFSPIRVGNIILKNRIGMSAMDTCYFSMEGTLTPKAVAHYLERAKGGAGLIVTEISPIDWPHGKNQLICQSRVNSPNEFHPGRYGCGKCEVGIPCETGIPGRKRG